MGKGLDTLKLTIAAAAASFSVYSGCDENVNSSRLDVKQAALKVASGVKATNPQVDPNTGKIIYSSTGGSSLDWSKDATTSERFPGTSSIADIDFVEHDPNTVWTVSSVGGILSRCNYDPDTLVTACNELGPIGTGRDVNVTSDGSWVIISTSGGGLTVVDADASKLLSGEMIPPADCDPTKFDGVSIHGSKQDIISGDAVAVGSCLPIDGSSPYRLYTVTTSFEPASQTVTLAFGDPISVLTTDCTGHVGSPSIDRATGDIIATCSEGDVISIVRITPSTDPGGDDAGGDTGTPDADGDAIAGDINQADAVPDAPSDTKTPPDTSDDDGPMPPDSDDDASDGTDGSETQVEGEADTSSIADTAQATDSANDTANTNDTMPQGDSSPDTSKPDTSSPDTQAAEDTNEPDTGPKPEDSICDTVTTIGGTTLTPNPDGSCDVSGSAGDGFQWGNTGYTEDGDGMSMTLDLEGDMPVLQTHRTTTAGGLDSQRTTELWASMNGYNWAVGLLRGRGDAVFCVDGCSDTTTWADFFDQTVTPGNDPGFCFIATESSTGYVRDRDQAGVNKAWQAAAGQAMCVNLSDLIRVVPKDPDTGCSSTPENGREVPSHIPGEILISALALWFRSRFKGASRV